MSGIRKVLSVTGSVLLWIFGVYLGLSFFLHGVRGYPRCEGVEPGGSCRFSSVRGTRVVDYEDLGKTDLVSLAIGSVILFLMALMLWFAVGDLRDRLTGESTDDESDPS